MTTDWSAIGCAECERDLAMNRPKPYCDHDAAYVRPDRRTEVSTYLYLTCLNHNPPLTADGESGQHLYDLPDIRADLANRAFIVAEHDRLDSYDRGYFGNNTLRFLVQHRLCSLGIIDEYDRSHPAVEPVNASDDAA